MSSRIVKIKAMKGGNVTDVNNNDGKNEGFKYKSINVLMWCFFGVFFYLKCYSVFG